MTNPLDKLWLRYFEWVDSDSFKDKETGEIYTIQHHTSEKTSEQGLKDSPASLSLTKKRS